LQPKKFLLKEVRRKNRVAETAATLFTPFYTQ